MPKVDKVFAAYLQNEVPPEAQKKAFNKQGGIPVFLVSRWAKYMPKKDGSVFSWVNLGERHGLHQAFDNNTKATEGFRNEAAKLAAIVQQIATHRDQIEQITVMRNNIALLQRTSEAEKHVIGAKEHTERVKELDKNLDFLRKQIKSLEKKALDQNNKLHKARHSVVLDMMGMPFIVRPNQPLSAVSDIAKKKLSFLYQHFDDQVAEVQANIQLLTELSKANPAEKSYSKELQENKEALTLLQTARKAFPQSTSSRKAANDLLAILEPLKNNPRSKRVYETMSPAARTLDKSLASTFLNESDEAMAKLNARWSILYTKSSGSHNAFTDASKLIGEMIQLYKNRMHLLTGPKLLEVKNSLRAWRKFQWEFDIALANSFDEKNSGLIDAKDPSVGSLYNFNKDKFRNNLVNIVTKLNGNLNGSKLLDQNNLYPLETSKMNVRRMQAMVKNVINIVEKDNSNNKVNEMLHSFHIPPQDAEVLLNRHRIKTIVSNVIGHHKILQAWIGQLQTQKADPAFIKKMQDVADKIEDHVKAYGAMANGLQKDLKAVKFDDYVKVRDQAKSKTDHLAQVLQEAEVVSLAIASAIQQAPNSIDAVKKNIAANLNKEFPDKDKIISTTTFDIVKELRKGMPVAAQSVVQNNQVRSRSNSSASSSRMFSANSSSASSAKPAGIGKILSPPPGLPGKPGSGGNK